MSANFSLAVSPARCATNLINLCREQDIKSTALAPFQGNDFEGVYEA